MSCNAWILLDISQHFITWPQMHSTMQCKLFTWELYWGKVLADAWSESTSAFLTLYILHIWIVPCRTMLQCCLYFTPFHTMATYIGTELCLMSGCLLTFALLRKEYNLNLSKLYNLIAVLLVEWHMLGFEPFGFKWSGLLFCDYQNYKLCDCNLVWAVSMVTHVKSNAFSFLKWRLNPLGLLSR
jgi:hypothetical protein